jgi:hypothetical protein
MTSFRIHLDIEKEYIILAIKKWYTFIEKEESVIPNLDFNFYIKESIHVTKKESKKSSILYGVFDDSKRASIDVEIYIDEFAKYLKRTFDKNKILVIRE